MPVNARWKFSLPGWVTRRLGIWLVCYPVLTIATNTGKNEKKRERKMQSVESKSLVTLKCTLKLWQEAGDISSLSLTPMAPWCQRKHQDLRLGSPQNSGEHQRPQGGFMAASWPRRLSGPGPAASCYSLFPGSRQHKNCANRGSGKDDGCHRVVSALPITLLVSPEAVIFSPHPPFEPSALRHGSSAAGAVPCT